MFSKNDTSKEVQDFMKGLGFPSNEEAELISQVVTACKGKIVTLKKGELTITGTLHSETLIFGNHLNLTKIDKEKTPAHLLEELHYYDPKNFNPEKGQGNFGFVSAAFDEDPKTTDLLVVPIDGVELTCENYTMKFPELEDEDD